MEFAAASVARSGFGSSIVRHVKDHFVPHERNHYAPHMLHHRTLVAFSLLLLTIKIVSVAAVLQFTPPTYVEASAITPMSVFELTNRSRAQNQIEALTYSQKLEQAAQAKANDMLARQYFAHNTPDGKTPWYFFDLVGYKYLSAGENLAVHFSDVEPLQDAWMNSPGHRANILNSGFKEMGVGIARGQFEGHESIFVVEEFGNPAVAASTETPTEQRLIKPQTADAAQPPVAQQQRTMVKVAPTETKAPTTSSPEVKTPTSEQQTLQSKQGFPVSQPISIGQATISTVGSQVSIEANASSNVSKLLLTYGQKARFFKPNANGTWSVSLPLESALSETLTIEAFDIQGHKAMSKLASITPTFGDRYAAPQGGDVKAASIEVFGQKLPVQSFEHKAYLGIIALLLTAMIIAIAVHKHLQHIRLIANSAFVVAFAALLLFF